ncbi:hypothetical protein FB451DRAFT_1179700 [Mycena latifolia]|nr:hypothetical protein FB451DRAFT_1179700 [Mycena latifolia]
MPPHHIAVMLMPSWGHTVSYIYLASRMLREDPTLVVIVQYNILGVWAPFDEKFSFSSDYPRSVALVDAKLKTCEYDRARLRILGVGDKDVPFPEEAFSQIIDGWKEGIMGSDSKILIWFSSALACTPSVLNEYDFAAIACEIYLDEARRQGRSLDEILEQIALALNGSDRHPSLVIKCPGIPDMRLVPERQAWPPRFVHAQKLAKAADGYVVPTSSCLKPVGVPYCKAFYQQRRQELFSTVGPQTHELYWTNAAPVPPANKIVRSFLENSMRQYGDKSVLYSLSVFFPVVTLELIIALVDTLLALEKPFPFIFGWGDVIERIKSSGKGLVCDFWVDQRAILQHAAVGRFLTHGGYNSISEAISQGIPLIMWPIDAEQLINAVLLSSGPNPVAVELMQVRTGPQRGPSLRGGPTVIGTVEDASAEFKALLEVAREKEVLFCKETRQRWRVR